MPYPLAIAAPQIGALSETFIRRHMEDLLPGKTLVVARESKGSYLGNWDVTAPSVVINRLHRKIFSYPNFGLRQAAQYYTPFEPDLDIKLAIQRVFQKHKIQVIMGEYLNYSFDFFAAARKLDIPYYAHGHGVDISACLKQPEWANKYMKYKDAAGIITMSEFSRQRLVEFGLDSDKIHVIPYGVNVPDAFLSRPNKARVCCLAVGRLVPKKAPITLLKAFKQAQSKYPSIHLDYIGDGLLFGQVKRFIKDHNLESFVTLQGSQPSARVRQFMDKADIFIQHSVIDPQTGDEEGLPVAILEAMAAGLPVVSTWHAGIPEAVLHQISGFLVSEGDHPAMGTCITHLAADTELRIRMGRAGWQHAQNRFTWQRERQDLLKTMGLSATIC